MKNTTNVIPKSDIVKVANLLIEHIGKKNPIKAQAICESLNFAIEANHIYCRLVITEAIKEYGLPIIASKQGYYIAENEEEVAEYFNRLDAQIKGIEERKKAILSVL